MTPPAAAELRVLVVGRDTIERRLRKDPTIEVLRARTGTDALGELALAAWDSDPGKVCVILAPDVIDEAHEADWLESMRRVDDGAQVLSLGGSMRAGFDGALAADADVAELRRALGAPASREAPEDAPRPPASPDTAPTTAPQAKMDAQAPVHGALDSAIVDAALRGEPVLGHALAALRERSGLEAVEFVGDDDAPQAPCSDAAPVVRHGARFGWLVAPGGVAAALTDAAAWLACWLALEAQRQQLQEAAFTDELTGAWNRRYFMRFLERSLDDARGQRRDVTLMVYDIDDFKKYNDAFGHAAGDAILCETTRLLRSVIRPTDRVCRIGGDEFAVIFDDPAGPRSGEGRHPMSIAEIAERFQRQVCAHRFPKLGTDAEGTLTISGGMATFPWDGHDAASLLERADALSLQSKRQGKNLITFGPGAERASRTGFGSRSEDRP